MGPRSSKQQKIVKKQSLEGSPQMGKKVSRDRSKKMSNQAVIVVDDRKELDEKNTIPFIGLIRGKFKSQSGCFIGTGALISEDLVLTAAHNLCTINSRQFKKYKEYLQSSFISSTNGLRSTESVTGTLNSAQMSLDQTINEFKHAEYAEWLQFYPGINGKMKGFSKTSELFRRNSQENFYKIKQFKVHPSYILNADNRKYDIAIFQLQRPVEYKEKIKIMEYYTNTNTEISVFGYPLDKCFKDQEGGVRVEQWGSKGKFMVNYDTGYLNYQLATSVGQSGSPVFINTVNNGKPQIFCIGIHTGGKEQMKTNIGIHFTEDKMQFIAETVQDMTGRLNLVSSMKLAELPPNNIPVRPQKIIQKPLKDYEQEIALAEEKKLQKMTKLQIYNIREAAALSLNDQDYQKAAKYYEKFISAIESLPAEQMNQDDEDQYEIALINLAKSYSQQGKYVQSYQLYEKVEQKCKEFFNFSVQKESTVFNNKGAVLVHLGRYDQALQMFKSAYNMRRNKFGEENLLTYSSFENLTSMKFKLGINLKQCVNEYERVVEYKEKKFGVGSKEQLKSKTNLAFVLFELKRYKEGVDCLRFCLEKYKLLLKSDSRESNKAMYAEFMKSFTSKMRELCKIQSSLEELRFASSICHQQKLTDLSRQLQIEWQKRKGIDNS